MKKTFIIITIALSLLSVGIYGFCTWQNYNLTRNRFRVKVEEIAEKMKANPCGRGDALSWSLDKGAAIQAALRKNGLDDLKRIIQLDAEDELDHAKLTLLASQFIGKEITKAQYQRDADEVKKSLAARWR